MPLRSKIINDPVHGFVRIPGETQFKLIEHVWFQRLRRIKQLGLTYLVYPAALHARFQHSLGAMHLMNRALNMLISKGHLISPQDFEDALNAILLHDIGHGPFSHTLENTLVTTLDHEQIGRAILGKLNEEMGGALQGAMAILDGTHPRRFLCQLVSGQTDMDRMDYLKRDSFYTSVAEGFINVDRLLAMLEIADDELVIESKGLFTIEHFLAARRMMYWQVYLHKTVLSAEFMLSRALLRARMLIRDGYKLDCPPALHYFLANTPSADDFAYHPEVIRFFGELDDVDVFSALKSWQYESDLVLKMLSHGILNRRLFKIVLQEETFDAQTLSELSERIGKAYGLNNEEISWLLITGRTANRYYNPLLKPIRVIGKDGTLNDIANLIPSLKYSALQNEEIKHFVCYPKNP